MQKIDHISAAGWVEMYLSIRTDGPEWACRFSAFTRDGEGSLVAEDTTPDGAITQVWRKATPDEVQAQAEQTRWEKVDE